jgi:Tol biopolymer transport system component
VARSASEIDQANELWVTDLQSGQAAQVLPGIAVVDYSASADGKRVVYEVRNQDGTTHLWLGSVDHRFTPKPIGPPNGKEVRYQPSGKIYFKVTEGNSDYMYRINEDGTQLQKLLPEPIISFLGVSPDERLVAVRRATKGEGSPTVVEAVSLTGGHDVPLCSELCSADWSFDGKTFYLRLPAMKSPNGTTETYVLPLARGADLPSLPEPYK